MIMYQLVHGLHLACTAVIFRICSMFIMTIPLFMILQLQSYQFSFMASIVLAAQRAQLPLKFVTNLSNTAAAPIKIDTNDPVRAVKLFIDIQYPATRAARRHDTSGTNHLLIINLIAGIRTLRSGRVTFEHRVYHGARAATVIASCRWYIESDCIFSER